MFQRLRKAAKIGGRKLFLVSGAIKTQHAPSSAQPGRLKYLIYKGRKPPVGWKGPLAEEILDLKTLKALETQFIGKARDAKLQYRKYANLAASVELAGLGF